jgi:hypothetical protein
MSAQHFTPWGSDERPCWHGTRFIGLLHDGTAARCSLPGGPGVRSMQAGGCSAFECEVGADDEPRAPGGSSAIAPLKFSDQQVAAAWAP